jgi:hypothetical protein
MIDQTYYEWRVMTVREFHEFAQLEALRNALQAVAQRPVQRYEHHPHPGAVASTRKMP